MITNKNFHTHTTFCDGKNTAEENVLAAISAGLSAIGFSGHSYTGFDESYCMKKEAVSEYIKEIHRLKDKYKDRINVYCGIEEDVFSDSSRENFDYIIGAVHYVKHGDKFIPVDNTKEIFISDTNKFFNGSFLAFAEAYFETVKLLTKRSKIDFIAHFDLISKFNERDCLFSSNDERYIRAWQSAADELITLNIPFEINTGAVARGLRTSPYPSPEIAEYISKKGGKFILSSDCHDKDMLNFYFDKAYEKYCGYNIIDFEVLIKKEGNLNE